MTTINENFSGYLKVDNDIFVYHFLNHIVTLLPAQSDYAQRNKVLDRLYSHDVSSPEYLFGECENYEIAMLRNEEFSGDLFRINPSVQFRTPVIIKASGNADGFHNMLTQSWDKFHAITFCGGHINSLYSPLMAIERPTFNNRRKDNSAEAQGIKIRQWDEYTRSVDFEVYGEKATLMISVMPTRETNHSENIEPYSLGNLNSFIKFSFENAQGFDKIIKYYKIAKSLVTILTAQDNVFFNVYISQRSADNQYFETGVCKFLDPYENYSTRKCGNVISISSILNCIPALIQKIANNEVEPLLTLLPKDNKRANKISITNVQDLCTALEVSYDWSKRGKEKDLLIEELKREIKTQIAAFSKNHNQINVRMETTWSNAFENLGYTLKEKILTMYNENCNAVDAIISKWSLPKLNKENVKCFVKLRNDKTHAGTVEWDNSEKLYTALLALEYACLFSHVGLSDEAIKSALLQIF